MTRHRLQIDMSPIEHERLEKIKQRIDAKTNAETVRRSLHVMEWILDQKDDDRELHSTDGVSMTRLEIIL